MLAAIPGALVDWAPRSLQPIYVFFGAALALFVVLSILRMLGRLRERQRELNSAWDTFRKVARARGLKGEQISALAAVARQAQLRRPAQVMGSIQVFDRSVGLALDAGTLTSTQQLLLEGVRKKLLSAAELHDEKRDRRQLERATCALRVGFVRLSSDELEHDAITSSDAGDDAALKERLTRLTAGMEPVGSQVINLSAGGLALMAGNTAEVSEGDYLGLSGDAAVLPVDLNGIFCQVREISELPEQAAQILHASFLPYDPAQKRKVIQLVYQQQEKKAVKPGPKRPGQLGGPGPAGPPKVQSDPGPIAPTVGSP